MADGRLDQATVDRWRRAPWEFVEEALADPETGAAYKLLPAERAFLEHAFEVGDDGRLKYPELIFACPKKSGKTAFAGMIALALTILRGGRYPECIVVANDLEQAQGRVFEAIRKIVECSPWLRKRARMTQTSISFGNIGATIKAIAADYAGAAGANPTITIFDELWAYTSERSRRLWDEAVVSPTRKISARLTVTYAGFEGESQLLEELYQRGMSLAEIDKDLRAGDGMLMFWSHDPIAPWQTAAWLAEMRRSLRPNQYLRMIENRWVSTESSFIEMSWFDDCVDPDRRMQLANPTLPVWVGIDASVKHDSTAIAVVCYDHEQHRCRLVWHKIFQPSPDAPLDFERTIERTVLDLKSRFKLRAVLFDPYQMQASAQRLRARGVRMQEYPQSVPNLTEASQNLYELIRSRNLILYADDEIRLAVSRAVAVEGSRGWKISKEKQSHKIDVVVALGMAALAASQQALRQGQPASAETWDDIFGSARLRREEAARREAVANVAAADQPPLSGPGGMLV